MATRSYLYSTNVPPGPGAKARGARLIGLAEWEYDVPLVARLLMSGAPRTCPSALWEHPHEIAIVGDYCLGALKLADFLVRIDMPEARPLVIEALEFINSMDNRNPYLLLEGAELFGPETRTAGLKNQALLESLRQPPADEIDEALMSLQALPGGSADSAGTLAHLIGRWPAELLQPHDPLPALRALGLGSWTNRLSVASGAR